MADESLTAGAVARRLGVAVTTLRTWHQRYGLGPTRHVAGQHRRYTPEDLQRLEVMRRLTAQGVTPAEAAAWARRVPGVPPGGSHPDGHRARDGGGSTIPVGRAGIAARGLARAAMRLDAHALRDIIEMVVANRGVVRAWDEAIRPVLVGIGDRYATSLKYIEVEHLISRSVTEALSSVDRPPAGTPRVLLAAADEEQHTLPLEALAAALAETGVPARLLGARVPTDALRDAVARTGPAVVMVWSQTADTGDPEQLTPLLSGPGRPLLVAAGGPGWAADSLPDEVRRPADLTEAVRLIVAVVAE